MEPKNVTILFVIEIYNLQLKQSFTFINKYNYLLKYNYLSLINTFKTKVILL